ncbi:MAG TPA: PqqD family protein [Gaiellaceae bacterium]|nr:PqqD family protein [Gaiellaceae bacterium]
MSESMGAARVELHPQVLHESIDGEVIAIDLATGTYYSLRGSAAEIWSVIQTAPGVSPQEISDALERRYAGSGGELAHEVTEFVAELVAEGLVRPVEGERPRNGRAALDGVAGTVHPFQAPRLEKYTDMQDLVLLDPVHEVGGGGWPHVPPDATERGAGA